MAAPRPAHAPPGQSPPPLCRAPHRPKPQQAAAEKAGPHHTPDASRTRPPHSNSPRLPPPSSPPTPPDAPVRHGERSGPPAPSRADTPAPARTQRDYRTAVRTPCLPRLASFAPRCVFFSKIIRCFYFFFFLLTGPAPDHQGWGDEIWGFLVFPGAGTNGSGHKNHQAN
jgi:hypothetical protein